MYMHDFIFQKSPGRYTVYQMIQKKKRVCDTHLKCYHFAKPNLPESVKLPSTVYLNNEVYSTCGIPTQNRWRLKFSCLPKSVSQHPGIC